MSSEPIRVLVVDDEPPIVELLTGYLAREGYTVTSVGDGLAAVDMVRDQGPDVVILDVMLPGLDGVEACRRIRSFSDAYVLMLTARGEEVDRIVGLTVGADDYLVKPFSPREVVARVKALLRRPRAGSARAVASGIGAGSTGSLGTAGHATGVGRTGSQVGAAPDGLTLDEGRRVVRVDGVPAELTALEFNLLARLAREPGIVVPRHAILASVWGPGFETDDHLVDVHVANLRRKLGDDPARPRFVETVRGVGYRLREGA
jgi:DNA-binding response OmpR family regulator